MTTPSGSAGLERARYEATLQVARVLRRTYTTRRSREQRTASNGRVVFAKRNLLGAGLMRLGGNLLQRIEGTGAEFLDDEAWFEREGTMSRALGREVASIGSDNTLLAPRVPGVDLATILRADAASAERKLKALAQSVGALRALHESGFTHADATCENVLIEGDAAHWIDFETRHREDLEPSIARADDLRALLFSSVWAAGDLASESTRRAFAAYPERDVWRSLAGLRGSTSGSLVRVAQAPMRWSLYAATWAAIIDVSASLTS